MVKDGCFSAEAVAKPVVQEIPKKYCRTRNPEQVQSLGKSFSSKTMSRIAMFVARLHCLSRYKPNDRLEIH
jgi:hypothetical protein